MQKDPRKKTSMDVTQDNDDAPNISPKKKNNKDTLSVDSPLRPRDLNLALKKVNTVLSQMENKASNKSKEQSSASTETKKPRSTILQKRKLSNGSNSSNSKPKKQKKDERKQIPKKKKLTLIDVSKLSNGQVEDLLLEHKLLDPEKWCRFCGARYNQWKDSPWGLNKLCNKHYEEWKNSELKLPETEPNQPIEPTKNTERNAIQLFLQTRYQQQEQAQQEKLIDNKQISKNHTKKK